MDILDTLVGFVANFTSAMNLGIPPTTLTLPRTTWSLKQWTYECYSDQNWTPLKQNMGAHYETIVNLSQSKTRKCWKQTRILWVCWPTWTHPYVSRVGERNICVYVCVDVCKRRKKDLK
jgi:hypothetical protein